MYLEVDHVLGVRGLNVSCWLWLNLSLLQLVAKETWRKTKSQEMVM